MDVEEEEGSVREMGSVTLEMDGDVDDSLCVIEGAIESVAVFGGATSA